jgi:hypothetical protein
MFIPSAALRNYMKLQKSKVSYDASKSCKNLSDFCVHNDNREETDNLKEFYDSI